MSAGKSIKIAVKLKAIDIVSNSPILAVPG